MLETVIFDWSGVISNDIPIVYNTVMKIHDFYGVKRTPLEVWKSNSKNPHSVYWKSVLPSVDMEVIQGLFNRFFEKEKVRPTILPGVKDTLELLNNIGINLFVLSSHPEQFVSKEAQDYGVAGYFVEIFSGKYYKDRKLVEIVEKYSLNKDKTLLAEDMVEGLVAGKTAGVRTAGILSGYHAREQFESLGINRPDYIFKDITGIKMLFH